jgi:hypothetical protein
MGVVPSPRLLVHAASLPPIRNARSVFLFFAMEVAFSKAIQTPWLASISFHHVSYLLSLPVACAFVSAHDVYALLFL